MTQATQQINNLLLIAQGHLNEGVKYAKLPYVCHTNSTTQYHQRVAQECTNKALFLLFKVA